MRLGRYGVDAPGLVKAFLLIGICVGIVGFGLMKWSGLKAWAVLGSGVLFLISAYGLGMFSYMLWGSLITKVRGRDAILDLISWTGEEQVLDVGCGRGLLLVGAAHRLSTGRAIGIDLWLERDQSGNEKTVALANAEAEGVADRVAVDTGDMRQLPFPDHSFDVVLSHWAVHNLEQQTDRTRALAEMLRVLRAGGRIVLTDISNREEYLKELRHLGCSNVQLVLSSALRDSVNKIISFGSFQPGTIVTTKSWMAQSMTNAKTFARVHPVHLRRSFALQAFGRFDPTATWSIEDTECFRKAFSRGSGVCTVTLNTAEDGVEVTAEGEEASSVVEELRLSLETPDGYDGFVPDSPVISRLHRELPGLRLFRVPWLFDIACSAVLQQCVKSTDAMRDWKNIAVRFGTKGADGLVAFPNAKTLAAVPLHSLQALGIDPGRARTLLSCAKEIKLYPLHSSLSIGQLRLRLSRIAGIGPWTVDMILGFGAGDCDAVPTGDLYLPHLVAFALAGEPRGTDERMIELLEPFRPNRFRVVKLLYAAKFKVPGW